MIGSLKPYNDYQSTVLRWAPEIPAHWSVRRAKTLLEPIDVRSETGEEELLTVSSGRGVVPRSDATVTMFKAESYVGHKLCWPGDLVINSLWAWGGGLGVSRFHGIVSTAYGVYRVRDAQAMDPGYLHELVRSAAFQWELQVRSKGVWISRLQLTDDAFLTAPLLLPPLGEQQGIGRVIGHLTTEVATAIRSKQELIGLLQERDSVAIHSAITGGTSEHTLRPSGVQWLGEVPEGWAVVPLRLRYEQCLGKMLDQKRIKGIDSLPYLRNTDVQWDRINAEDLPVMDIARSERDRYTVKAGDLLVCEGGVVGRCAIWSGPDGEFGYQKALHRLRPRDPKLDHPRFLYYALRAATEAGAFNDGHKSTIAHLTGEKLRAHRFAFPPLPEQLDLISRLDAATARTAAVVSSIKSEIALLTELRNKIAADLVTGRLDCQTVAATLEQVNVLDALAELEESSSDEGDFDDNEPPVEEVA